MLFDDDDEGMAGETCSSPVSWSDPGPEQEASFSSLESRCHSLLSKILGDAHQRALVCKLSEDDAQLMVDYLDMVSGDSEVLNVRERRRALALLCKLAKSAQVFPRRYQLTEVKTNGQPVKCGGFADIYRENYRDQVVCVKVFRRNEDLARTCAPELTLWAHLRHENILPFYGVCLLDPTPCLVSPWMEKGNVRDYLKRFPEKPRMPFISDILDGLSYLHGLHIVHGDLKAENVLVSMTERALITDFGLSSMAATSQLMYSSPIGGSLRWMAPELFTGDGQTRSSCDIWSFGCLCYEILTGKVPFHQYDDRQVLAAIMRKEIPLRPKSGITADLEGIGDQLWDLLVKCWNEIPEGRPGCTVLQESISTHKIQDNRSEAVAEVESCSAFREKTSVEINFVLVEEVFNQILLSPHVAPTMPSQSKKKEKEVLNQERDMSVRDSGYLSFPGGNTLSTKKSSSWLGEPSSSLPLSNKSGRNDFSSEMGRNSPPDPKKATTLPSSFGQEESCAGGRENKSTKTESREHSRNRRSNTFTSVFSRIFRKSAPRDISVRVIEREALKLDDYVIAITGVGRSTFISTATGYDSRVDHGAVSETVHVFAVRITFPDAINVVLVDTPQLDNTYLSDLHVLRLVSDWLQDTVALSGILYLHRISENLMSGTPLEHLDMLEKLCGGHWFRKVVLVIMWQGVDQEIGLSRQNEIQCDCWAEMVKRGSEIVHFDGTKTSAWTILGPLIAQESDKRSIGTRKDTVGLAKDLGNVAPRLQLYLRIEGQKDALRRMKDEMKNTTDPAVMQRLISELDNLRKEVERAMADMRQLDSPMTRRSLRNFWINR